LRKVAAIGDPEDQELEEAHAGAREMLVR